MNLRDRSVYSGKTLDYFIQLTENMNYTQAAEILGISQPALTQRIKKFEKAIGAPLFYFKGKEMHLTQTGHSMLRATKAVYTIFKGVAEEIECSNIEIEEHIKIGISMSIEEQKFLDFLAAFYEENNKRKISLYTLSREELWLQLEREQIDIAILYLPDNTMKDWNTYAYKNIVSEELYFFQPNDLLTKKKSVKLKDTMRQRWITYLPSFYINDLLRNAFKKQNLSLPTVAGYFSTPNQALQFSQQTGYCTVLPESFLKSNFDQENLYIKPFDPPIQYSIAFVYRKEEISVPRIKSFFQFFEKYFKENNSNSRLKG